MPAKASPALTLDFPRMAEKRRKAAESPVGLEDAGKPPSTTRLGSPGGANGVEGGANDEVGVALGAASRPLTDSPFHPSRSSVDARSGVIRTDAGDQIDRLGERYRGLA